MFWGGNRPGISGDGVAIGGVDGKAMAPPRQTKRPPKVKQTTSKVKQTAKVKRTRPKLKQTAEVKLTGGGGVPSAMTQDPGKALCYGQPDAPTPRVRATPKTMNQLHHAGRRLHCVEYFLTEEMVRYHVAALYRSSVATGALVYLPPHMRSTNKPRVQRTAQHIDCAKRKEVLLDGLINPPHAG